MKALQLISRKTGVLLLVLLAVLGTFGVGGKRTRQQQTRRNPMCTMFLTKFYTAYRQMEVKHRRSLRTMTATDWNQPENICIFIMIMQWEFSACHSASPMP